MCDLSWYDDAKSSYVLSTASQLAGLAYLVDVEHVTFAGKTVLLANDIDLSGICSNGVNWRPIGTAYTSGESFQGTFDGQGHTVSNLLIDDSGYYNALFGSVSHATIANLTVSGEVRGSEYVGGIVSMCTDSDLINLVNTCTVDAYTYNAGTNHEGRAAGVVCYVATSNPSSNHVFENLVNQGDIYATSYYTAGVVGFLYNADGFSTTLSQCVNYGDVNVLPARYGLDAANRAVGGVLGSTAGDYGTYIVEACANEGAIASDNCISVGGVAGYLGGNGSSLSFSENRGDVSGANNAGGVVGYLGSVGGSVRNSLNMGVVHGNQYGGVVGSASRSGQSLSNNFTLKSACDVAYGAGSGGTNRGAARTAQAMQKQSFLDLVNEGTTSFSISSSIAGGLPVLTWMYPGINPGRGGAVDDSDEPETEDEPSEGGNSRDAGAGDQTDSSSQDGRSSGAGRESEGDYQNPSGPADDGSDKVGDPARNDRQGATGSVDSDAAGDAGSVDPDGRHSDESAGIATVAQDSGGTSAAAAAAVVAAPSGLDAPEDIEVVPDVAVDNPNEDVEEPADDQVAAPEDSEDAPQEQEAGRAMKMVEVAAVPERREQDAGAGDALPLAARVSMAVLAIGFLAAGFVYENRSFSQSCRRSVAYVGA